MAVFKNALDKLTQLLEPQGLPVLAELYQLITQNTAVLARGLLFSPWALREFLGAFRTGMVYAATHYPESIPKDFFWYRNPSYCGQPFNDIIYRASEDEATDEIVMSHVYIAFFANAVEHGIIARACDHLPEKFGASATTCAICHAIEECYHRYQTRVRGEMAVVKPGERDHPFERAIFPIIAKAIEDMSLPLYPIC